MVKQKIPKKYPLILVNLSPIIPILQSFLSIVCKCAENVLQRLVHAKGVLIYKNIWKSILRILSI